MLLLVAMFALVACDNNDNKPQRSEYDIAIDNLMAQCKNFDAEILTQGLVGEWKEDSFLSYDDEWKTITSAWYIMGEMNCEGLSPSYYSFTADGKGVERCYYCHGHDADDDGTDDEQAQVILAEQTHDVPRVGTMNLAQGHFLLSAT